MAKCHRNLLVPDTLASLSRKPPPLCETQAVGACHEICISCDSACIPMKDASPWELGFVIIQRIDCTAITLISASCAATRPYSHLPNLVQAGGAAYDMNRRPSGPSFPHFVHKIAARMLPFLSNPSLPIDSFQRVQTCLNL